MRFGLGFGMAPRRAAGGGSAPLAVGSAVAALGDSMFNRGNSFTTAVARTIAENRQNSEIMWAMAYMQGCFRHMNWWDPTATQANLVPDYAEASATSPLWRGLNFGLSGDTATGCLRRVPQVIASGADLCVVSAGTNQGAGDNASVVIAVLEEIVGDLVAGGVRVVLGTVRPRKVSVNPTGSEISPETMGRILTINEAIRSNWSGWGASALFDPWEELRDTSQTEEDDLYGTCNDNFFMDGVHLNPRGAAVSGAVLATAMGPLFAAQTPYWADYDNLLANPGWTGTGGTANNGCSGTLPDNTFCSNVAGAGQPVTGVCSVDNGTVHVDATSTGDGTAGTFGVLRMSFTNPSEGFESTDWVVAAFKVRVPEACTALRMIQCTLGQGSTVSARGHYQSTGSYNDEPTGFMQDAVGTDVWICTEPLLVESRTSLNPRLDMIFANDVAASDERITILERKLFVLPFDVETEFPWVA